MKYFDHYWGIVIAFLAALAAFTVLAVTGNGQQGTLLRAVILTLAGGIGGAYFGKSGDPPTK